MPQIVGDSSAIGEDVLNKKSKLAQALGLGREEEFEREQEYRARAFKLKTVLLLLQVVCFSSKCASRFYAFRSRYIPLVYGCGAPYSFALFNVRVYVGRE